MSTNLQPLVPLPQCPRPKLKPFDFQGPQAIEFIDLLGRGVHSEVYRVKIFGQMYALKLVSLNTSIMVRIKVASDDY